MNGEGDGTPPAIEGGETDSDAPVEEQPNGVDAGRKMRRKLLVALLAVVVVAAGGIGGVVVGSYVVELNRRIASLERLTSQLHVDPVSGKATVDQLGERLDHLESSLSDMETPIRDLELALSQVKRDRQASESDISRRIDDLEGDLASVRTDLASVQVDLASVRTDLDWFQTDMDTRFQNVGRCLYLESEHQLYRYWYRTDSSGDRYITDCE